jgi:DNA-binding HxlR family transcriptional regulator
MQVKNEPPMPAKKTPRRSGCPISYSLEIFGDRWTLLVLRDLLLKGRRHFKELLAAEEGIATNILTDRLQRLEAFGVLRRVRDPEDRRRRIYRPTDKGIALLPVLLELAAWGAEHDSETAAPSGFVARFTEDREAVLEEFRRSLTDD